MKKLIVLLVGCLLSGVDGYAQAAPSKGAKEVAVSAMLDYATLLYQRNESDQATQMFKRVLAYDPQNAFAQKYLAKLDPSFKLSANKNSIDNNLAPNALSHNELSTAHLQATIAKKTQEIQAIKQRIEHVSTGGTLAQQVPSVENTQEFEAYLKQLQQDVQELRQHVDAQSSQIR